jgi:hypothetical protein
MHGSEGLLLVFSQERMQERDRGRAEKKKDDPKREGSKKMEQYLLENSFFWDKIQTQTQRTATKGRQEG